MLSDKREIRSGMGRPMGSRRGYRSPHSASTPNPTRFISLVPLNWGNLLKGPPRNWSARPRIAGLSCAEYPFGSFNGADPNTSLGFTNQIPYFLKASVVRGASTVLPRYLGFGGFKK